MTDFPAIKRRLQYTRRVRSGKVKQVHDANPLNKGYYDVYLKANSVEEEKYLQRVPARFDVPQLVEGQGVTVEFPDDPQYPLITGCCSLGNTEQVDIATVKTTSIVWYQFHRDRTCDNMIAHDVMDKIDDFKSYWVAEAGI